jgi:hypothetical protein
MKRVFGALVVTGNENVSNKINRRWNSGRKHSGAKSRGDGIRWGDYCMENDGAELAGQRRMYLNMRSRALRCPRRVENKLSG